MISLFSAEGGGLPRSGASEYQYLLKFLERKGFEYLWHGCGIVIIVNKRRTARGLARALQSLGWPAEARVGSGGLMEDDTSLTPPSIFCTTDLDLKVEARNKTAKNQQSTTKSISFPQTIAAVVHFDLPLEFHTFLWRIEVLLGTAAASPLSEGAGYVSLTFMFYAILENMLFYLH